MGAHAMLTELNLTSVPFSEAIQRIESLRDQLAEMKPIARTDAAVAESFGSLTDDLRAAYAELAAQAATKVANWRPADEFLQ